MAILFHSDIPEVPISKTTNEELSELYKKFPSFDTFYVASAALAERKEVYENFWKKYEPFADKDFIQQAQKGFLQRMWEMYLGNVLLENNLALERAGEGAPDIKIVSTNPTTWVECVMPTSGITKDRVPDTIHGTVQDVPWEQMLLRMTQSFEAKSEQIKEHIQNGKVGANEPRIIAVNIGGLRVYVDGDPPLILRMLFAIGYPVLHFNKNHSKVIGTSFTRIDSIQKKSGENIPLAHFLNDQYKHISAVIYSTYTLLNRPEHIGTECAIAINPFAEVPLSPDTFPFMTKYVSKDKKVYPFEPHQAVVL